MTLIELYEVARDNEIEVDCYDMRTERGAFSISIDGDCYIAIDPFKLESTADEKTKLAHELGHCMTGAFYYENSGITTRLHQEYIADKWAVRAVIPHGELLDAVRRGYTQPWEIADYFDVNEELVRKAMWFYENNEMI